MKSNDPSAFWKLLNKNEDKTDENMPKADEFREMFLNLGNDISYSNEEPVLLDDNIHNNFDNTNSHVSEILNSEITAKEIQNAIKTLKNNKAHGTDLILNEFLKNSENKLLDILVKLFNLILDNGIFPSAWTIGVIRPIFKNKGNRENPNNYRGITILSCFGKLFTNILNRRLNTFLDNLDVIGNEQAGFRKGYSTNDHIFTLYSLIEILLRHKKRLYCAFLDLEKAFDKVNRTFLWQKLFACGVNGKFLKLITNLYQSAKSCVLVENSYSNYFKINCGVRQGENLSPTLFALFLNDMKSFLEPSMNGLPTLRDEMARHNLNDVNSNPILKLFLLLYADDSIIFAEKPEELQLGLNLANEYCGKCDV